MLRRKTLAARWQRNGSGGYFTCSVLPNNQTFMWSSCAHAARVHTIFSVNQRVTVPGRCLVKYEEKARQKVAWVVLACPWVLPGLTCSYTPSYLPVGVLRWSHCWWQWRWRTCLDMDQGGLNLIWVLSKRTAGGIKAIFRPIYLSFRCKIWMGNVSALFALRRKKAKLCLHSVLCLSVWEKGR